MRNRFSVNEEEKNRIRGLHSLLNEQRPNVGVDPVGIDPIGPVGPELPIGDPASPIGGGPCPPTDTSSPWFNATNFCQSDWCVPNITHADCHCCDDDGTSEGCVELWVTKCAGPTDPGHAVGQSNLHFPCAEINGGQPTQMHVGQKVKKITGSPSVYVIDTVGPNPNHPGPPANLTTNASCDPTGGMDDCQCCKPGGPVSMSSPVPAGTCSSYNNGTNLYNCQVAPPLGGIITCDSPQTWDCKSTQINSQCVPVAGSGGQYATQSLCQQNCGEKRFACVPKETGPPNGGGGIAEQASSTTTMVCIQQPMGPYTSMAQCQDECGKKYCINCKESQMVTTQMTGTKDCPPGYVEVVGTPGNFQPPCYQCNNGTCNGPGWFNGGMNVYNSLQECQNGVPGQPPCDIPQQDYNCDPTSGCQPVSNGTYTGPTALADCQAVCNVDPCPAILQSWSWWQSIQTNGPKPCNNICSKIEVWIDANTPPNSVQNQCYMDYAVTQASQGNCSCQPPSSFINQKTTHFGNFGCCGELQSNMPVPAWACGFGTGNVKPNSVCGWFDAQCTSGSLGWMKQTKCDWLDNNILGGCNCNI